jgi:hypothetical protein
MRIPVEVAGLVVEVPKTLTGPEAPRVGSMVVAWECLGTDLVRRTHRRLVRLVAVDAGRSVPSHPWGHVRLAAVWGAHDIPPMVRSWALGKLSEVSREGYFMEPGEIHLTPDALT